jgi:hypothetical protein
MERSSGNWKAPRVVRGKMRKPKSRMIRLARGVGGRASKIRHIEERMSNVEDVFETGATKNGKGQWAGQQHALRSAGTSS